jgi:molybdopterin-containing oxidoreductase family iron-sulfur binding subunit
MLKQADGWKAVSWDEALALAGEKLAEARRGGRGIALLTGHEPGSSARLARAWAQAAGGTHLAWEAFAWESQREANRRAFGQASVARHDLAAANLIVSFGADFLETWVSPVDHARDFAAFRARPETRFVAIEPRLSLTGSNADEWLAARPGSETLVALALAHVIVSEGIGTPVAAGLRDALAPHTPEVAAAASDLPAETLVALARRFAAARPGVALAGGIAAQSEHAVSLALAVNLLNWVAGNLNQTVRFDRTPEPAASFADLQALAARMNQGAVDVLVVHGTNPVHTVPAWANLPGALDRVSFKVALATQLDETSDRCDLVLPASHPLETLGDLEPARGVHSLIQPAMQPLPQFDARPAGEALLALARSGGFGDRFPATWTEWVQARWRELLPRFGEGRDFDAFWHAALQRGGAWEEAPATPVSWTGGAPEFALPMLRGSGEVALVIAPTAHLHDGRGASRPWLQELPDPTTKAVWGSWAELHPATAERLGLAQGDPLKVETDAGSVEVPVYLYAGVRHDVVALPLGQGHTANGRYANGRGVNPLGLLPAVQDAACGAVAYLATRARLSKGTRAETLVVSQIHKTMEHRGVAQVIPVEALLHPEIAGEADHGAAHGHGVSDHQGPEHEIVYPGGDRPGAHTEPLARPDTVRVPAHAVSAFVPHEKARAPRQIPVAEGSYKHAKHRWAMAIDLNACTGCSACVVACNAENNIPVVGPALIQRGREMSWIRIERFEEQVGEGASDVRHVPMMCQHCSDAPCETVCPVYATYHNPEGLNAQVYNRCVGTRYCSNNCPYKVRAFNFFDYGTPEREDTFAFPEPLNWQLNPDVTVRSKGVMEKCTMCIQRILEGKGVAKDEGRSPRDGEIQTACAQSCPTQAIVFGDLLDPGSRVARISYQDARRYWVFSELNTRPGVTYLRRVTRGPAKGPAEG